MPMLLHKYLRSQNKKTRSILSGAPNRPVEALPGLDHRCVQMISGGVLAAGELGEEVSKPEQERPLSEDVAAEEAVTLVEQTLSLLDEEGTNDQCLAGMMLRIMTASGDLLPRRFLRTLGRLTSGEEADKMFLEGDTSETFWNAH